MENNEIVKELSLPLYASKGWLKFIGVMLIIFGALYTLGTFLIGAIVAWIPIWQGVLLYQAAGAVEQANAAGDQASFQRSLEKLKVYFIITGVLMIISLVAMVLAFVFVGAAGIMGVMSAS